jgi:hypothetical protein
MALRGKSWRRVVLLVATTFVVLWLLAELATPVMIWHEAKQWGRDYPAVALMPTMLTDTRVAPLGDGVTIRRYGYSIHVPWGKTKVVKDFKTISSFGFDDGSSMLIFDPADRTDLIGASTAAEPRNREALDIVLGRGNANSHYGAVRAALAASPNDVSLFGSQERNVRAEVLLPMKMIEMPKDITVIYEIVHGPLRGYQFGDPGKAPTFVELLLFDARDRGLRILFKGPPSRTTPVLTQAQLNAIVASVQTPQ